MAQEAENSHSLAAHEVFGYQALKKSSMCSVRTLNCGPSTLELTFTYHHIRTLGILISEALGRE